MSYKSFATNEGILAYGITTKPEPIQVSPENGNFSDTSITITVSNNTTELIYCNQLQFSFPIGDLAQDLASNGSGIVTAADPSDKWQISVSAEGTFTANPRSPIDNLITTDGLSFHIYGIQTNKQVGTFTFTITECSSTDNKNFSNKTNTYELTKFPYGFYVSDFAASAPMVNDGETVTLTWSGSDIATYTIYYDKESVDVTNVRIWTSPALSSITTFALKASAQEEGKTVDHYLYITVIVANPDLKVTSLNVLQTSTTQDLTAVNKIQVGDTKMPSVVLSSEGDIVGKSLTTTNITMEEMKGTAIVITKDIKAGNVRIVNNGQVVPSLTIGNTVLDENTLNQLLALLP